MQLVSLYVDQFPERDLALERSRRFNVPIYPTVEEALTRLHRRHDHVRKKSLPFHQLIRYATTIPASITSVFRRLYLC